MGGSAVIGGTVKVVDNAMEDRPLLEGVGTSAVCGGLSAGMGTAIGSAGSNLTDKVIQGTAAKVVATTAVSASASALTSATVTVTSNLL